MKNSENSIDNVLMALEEAIKDRRTQMQNAETPSEVSQLYSGIFNRVGSYYAQMTSALGNGKELAQGFLNKALQDMHEEPWEFVRKTAMYSFAIGLFLSLRQRKVPTEKKE